MADDIKPNPGAAAPVAATPATLEAPVRATVPASAVFDGEDMTPPTVGSGSAPTAPAKPAEPAQKPNEPAAGVKPAEPAQKPNEPAAGVKPADSAAPAVPETKIKVAGKEYTQAELEKALADANKPAAAPAPAAPVAAAPAPAAPVAPTPEQIATQETEWRAKFVNEHKVSIPFTKDETETFLSGGDDAAALISRKLSESVAHAVLLARKTIYQDVNPMFQQITNSLQPVVQHQEQLQRVATEQYFVGKFPDYAEHIDTARFVADELVKQYRDQVSQMSLDDFLTEVSSQTNRILQTEYKRWHPTATDTWLDAKKRSAGGAGTTAPTTPPTVQAAAASAAPVAGMATPNAPVAPTAPVATAAPSVPAPASHSPGAVTSTAPGKTWHQSVAMDLQS